MFGSQVNSTLRLGIIGCGGRGRASTTAMINHTNTRIVAIADLFEDQLQSGKKYYNDIAAQKDYVGIDAKNLLLGRMAAYQAGEVTREKMLASDQSYQGDVDLTQL